MDIYVFGLGHIGLPMACFTALKGKSVIGIDTNQEVVREIADGTVGIYEYYKEKHVSQLAKELIAAKKLTVVNKYTRIKHTPAVFIICVGISSSNTFEQDISPLINVVDTLIPSLIEGDLIIFRTTLIPSTIDTLILPKIKALSFPVYVSYCPETISEGHAFNELEVNSLILAGMNDESYLAAYKFFKSLSDTEIFKASNIKTAELIKVVQNVSRDVNIALINELSDAAREIDVDIYEIQRLASTHPRVELLTPGLGAGGYCLPNALIYLRSALENTNINTLPLMDTARRSNILRPQRIAEYVEDILIKHEKAIGHSTIAVIGLAMKDNCADCRYSPSIDLINILISKGAKIKAFDPLVTDNFPFKVNSFNECIKNSDCMIIAAHQPEVEYNMQVIKGLLNNPPIIIDTRNVITDERGLILYHI